MPESSPARPFRAAILTLLRSGCAVSTPYATRPVGSIMEAEVTPATLYATDPPTPVFALIVEGLPTTFDSPEAAVDELIRVALAPSNLGLAIQGIRRHDLGEPGDMNAAQLKRAAARWRRDHFATDFPGETP